ncbi:MAG: DUF2244 domain-containing protein [Paracoccaceae bacterium]
MPYLWNNRSAQAPEISGAFAVHGQDAPLARLEIWPHRSLPRQGFVWVIGLFFGLGLIPVLPLLGSRTLWVVLLFSMSVLAAVWVALEHSYRRGLREELLIWSDLMVLTRHNPRGAPRQWQAHPYWVRIALDPDKGPVEQYLTLHGSDREVELGAFLSPEERGQLRDDLAFVLGQLKR